MWSGATLEDINRKAERESQRGGKKPVILWPMDEERPTLDTLEKEKRGIPYIGERCPRGWRLVKDYDRDEDGCYNKEFFVGMYSEKGDGISLGLADFLEKIVQGRGYGMREHGQLQCYIRDFELIEK